MQRRSNVAIQASEVLATGGIPALKGWLAANRSPLDDRDLFIIGPDGRDILGRKLSTSAARRLDFFHGLMQGPEMRPHQPPPPGNFRPPHFAPQIVGPDGVAYTVLLLPRRPTAFAALTLPGTCFPTFRFALVVSPS